MDSGLSLKNRFLDFQNLKQTYKNCTEEGKMVLDATPGASLVVLLVAAVKKYGS
ncbi:hypothetical protein [Brevibacillus sp. SYSU BS000544]|uniref:hypothetical protein n=1 Tax=Brevibacillus sp. SYSU BS000544 TaxID=3416443 RepID=UPI003CE4E90F